MHIYSLFLLIFLIAVNIYNIYIYIYIEGSYLNDTFIQDCARRQLELFTDTNVAFSLFGVIFGCTLDKGNNQLFGDEFNPQSALALTTLYSKVIMQSFRRKVVIDICIYIYIYILYNRPVKEYLQHWPSKRK